MHFDLDSSVACAILASTTLDVKRESALLIAASLGLLSLRKQFSNFIEDSCVRGWVRARRATNRLLINGDNFVYEIDPRDGGVVSNLHLRSIEVLL
jgi:hypothetical protein